MADKIVGPNEGVPMGDGNGGTEGSSGNQQQGGGNSTPGPTASTSGSSGSSGSGTSGTSDCPDCELVESVVEAYLKAAALTLTYEALVPIYVDNKLGFAKLAKEYKEKNPDVDPDEIDEAVDAERTLAIEAFTEDGSNAKVELQKKYDDFKSSMAEIKKSITELPKEIAKTVGEAIMPTTIGLGGPNPLSIALKLFNGITKIKRILDAIFGALALFMTTAKALGLDSRDEYRDVMVAVAKPLRIVQDIISKKESDAQYQENLVMDEYLQTAKENWPAKGMRRGVDYKVVEDYGKEGIEYNNKILTVSVWPIQDPYLRNDVADALDYYVKKKDGKHATTIDKLEAIIKYSDYLGWTLTQFKDYYQKILQESNSNNNTTYGSSSGTVSGTTTTPGSNPTDTGGNSKGPGGI